MILLPAFLFAISAGCAIWIVIRRYENQRAMSNRLSRLAQDAPSPTNLYEKPMIGLKKETELTQATNKSDKLANELFLAGMRSKRQLQIYKLLLKLSLIVPFIIIGIFALTGSLDMENMIRAGFVGLAIAVYVRFSVKVALKKRRKKILRELPQFLDLLVICVEAGLNFTAAIERMLKEVDPNEPLTKEFSLMYQEYLGGFSLAQACGRLDKRCGVADLSVILNAIVQSDQMGASLGGTLRVQAEELRDKYRQRMREKAYRIPIKILFPTLMIFFTIFVITLGPTFYQMSKVMAKIR